MRVAGLELASPTASRSDRRWMTMRLAMPRRGTASTGPACGPAGGLAQQSPRLVVDHPALPGVGSARAASIHADAQVMTMAISWSEPWICERSRETIGSVGSNADGGRAVEEAGEVPGDESAQSVGDVAPVGGELVDGGAGAPSWGPNRASTTCGRVGSCCRGDGGGEGGEGGVLDGGQRAAQRDSAKVRAGCAAGRSRRWPRSRRRWRRGVDPRRGG